LFQTFQFDHSCFQAEEAKADFGGKVEEERTDILVIAECVHLQRKHN